MIGKKKKKAEMNQENDDLITDQEKETNVEEQPLNDKDGTDQKVELSPEQIIEEQKNQISELNDKFLRLYAEFDNFRKRTLRERIDLIQSASSEIMTALLPVLDDFNRALKAFEQSNEVEALKTGIVLVNQKFTNILQQKGLEEIKSLGEPFNTDLHEAIANIDAPDEEDKGKVIEEVEKGYFLNGKVLRYAKVVVAN